MLSLIISSGQYGTSLAALRAAKDSYIKTGGSIPFGCSKTEYTDLYGLIENESVSYFPSIYQNVKDSDGTIILAVDLYSIEEKYTLNAIEQYKKPYFNAKINSLSNFAISLEMHPKTAAKWIFSHNIKVLNIAGNAEDKYPGIENWVYRYVSAMIKYSKEYL